MGIVELVSFTYEGGNLGTLHGLMVLGPRESQLSSPSDY